MLVCLCFERLGPLPESDQFAAGRLFPRKRTPRYEMVAVRPADSHDRYRVYVTYSCGDFSTSQSLREAVGRESRVNGRRGSSSAARSIARVGVHMPIA
ncbi:hypothetical protein B0G77_4565 [Paraburkholderia sp. BL10I2N1]|nr:hypothetical protein B0G77_4565 [Paraburkholderia sp. BL10I2N1]